MVMAPPSSRDSAPWPCFRGCLAFLHRHLPPQPSPSYPLDLSLRSQQQPSPWDCSTVPQLQLPAPVPSGRAPALPGVCMVAARTVILIPSRLPQISCFALSLKCFSSDSDSCLAVGIGPLLQFPHLPRAGPILLTLLFPRLVRSRKRLSDFTSTFHLHALEKEMATYSSVLAWRIPVVGEPGGLPSMGSHRVGFD